MTTSQREIIWSKAMGKLSGDNTTFRAIPSRLDHLVTEEVAVRLLEIVETYYMGMHRNAISGLIASPQSPEYIVARLNSLHAFRHLADPESSVNETASMIHLTQAIGGLSGDENKFAAVDYSTPDRYNDALARLTVVIGMFNLGNYQWQGRRLLKYRNGVYMLPEALEEIVKRHESRAALIVEIISQRNLKSSEFDLLEDMLAANVPAALISGAL